MSNIFNFTKQEKKIRKHWLISTFILVIGFPLIGLIFSVFLRDVSIARESLSLLFAGLFGFWFIYHCTYKKPGIKLLTWWLIITPIRLLLGIINDAKQEGLIITLLALIIEIPFYIWWFKKSLELKKINIMCNKVINERLNNKVI